jgi:peptide/nickel transport system ATP-binding protein
MVAPTESDASRNPASPPPSAENVLEVRDLRTYFGLDEGTVRALDGVSFDIKRDSVLGIVGESGCGKSVLARSIMSIVQPPGYIPSGEINFTRPVNGVMQTDDLVQLDPDGEKMRSIRGGEITMVFQEPMVSFSPVYTIGNQIMEAVMLHQKVSKAEARNRTIEMLGLVGIPNPERRIDEYPFNFSGGMRQRAMIAMALSSNPKLLIADEPTTALDVTTQAQILELLLKLQEEFGMAMILITHNLGLVAQMAKEVAVMYLGKMVEQTDVGTLFSNPQHPYTQELLRSIPRLGRTKQTSRLTAIKGSVPPPYSRPSGCAFHPRCPKVISGVCEKFTPEPIQLSENQFASCLLYSDAEEHKMGETLPDTTAISSSEPEEKE